MTHQNPQEFLSKAKQSFVRDLTSRLRELKHRCRPGTVDTVVLGGNYFDQVYPADPSRTQVSSHKDSINELTRLIRSVFGAVADPVVLSGPNYSDFGKASTANDLIFDTQARVVLSVRPEQLYPVANETYAAKDARDYFGLFDEAKILSGKQFQPSFPRYVYDENLKQLRQWETGILKEKNFVSNAERRVHERLREDGFPVWLTFARQDPNDLRSIWVDAPASYLEMTLVPGVYDGELKAAKLDAVYNFDDLIGRMMVCMKRAADLKFKIFDKSALLYFKKALVGADRSARIDFLLTEYRYIEPDSPSDPEEILLQNIAVCVNSLHEFLDMYVKEGARKSYLSQLRERVDVFLKKNVSEQTYRSAMHTF